MARRSNKTAHVLNLLAGHDSQNTAEESGKNEESASPAAAAPENAAAGRGMAPLLTGRQQRMNQAALPPTIP